MRKFIPNEYHKSVHDVDLVKLYDAGKRLILTDLDNTLVGYETVIAPEEIMKFKDEAVNIGFEFIILSNNRQDRVKKFANSLGVEFYSNARKPFKTTFKRAVSKFDPREVVMIGDQLLTDILGGNRMGFYTILVEVINYSNEGFFTRVNRYLERRLLKRGKIKGDQ
ncbi:YqeG family HAD IIIA-type phosphatase [Haloplasma contractile]|uniref:4-nitrophenyl phosphatase protein n=1 Tax=Haloplasma contractile SSD-17B TaxID=1033810 RepID=U2FLV7_9MOLU|nr:YqeG family HAD IIIA-type phosphatase [Haloplasma contractile]ERJ13725.1 4-nitrophenyl phosphatase protein [Haloplasma contractile SSD-17B]